MGITPYWGVGASAPKKKVKRSGGYIIGGPVGMMPAPPEKVEEIVSEDDEWKRIFDEIFGRDKKKKKPKDNMDDIDWSDWDLY